MSSDPIKSTEEFFNGINAKKASGLYLPGSTTLNRRKNNFVYIDKKPISQARLSNLHEVLIWAGSHIPWPYTEMYEHMGVSRTEGIKLVNEAINIAWITEKQYHPSRRGGCIKIPRPTEKGWQELESLGKKRPEAVLGGGDDHDLGGKVLKVLGNRQGYTCGYEILIGIEKNVRPDVVLQNTKGERIYCQCCFSDAGREAISGCQILSVIPVETSKVLFVCKDKVFSESLLKLLSKEGVYQQNKERVFIRVFGDLLEAYYKKTNQSLL